MGGMRVDGVRGEGGHGDVRRGGGGVSRVRRSVRVRGVGGMGVPVRVCRPLAHGQDGV